MDTKEKIAVMQAHVDGKLIEVKYRHPKFENDKSWCVIRGPEPEWDWAVFDYRIAPKKIEGWVNVYQSSTPKEGNITVAYMYPTKDKADHHAASGRIACILITCVEGEGL